MSRNFLNRILWVWVVLTLVYFLLTWGFLRLILISTEQFFIIAFLATVVYASVCFGLVWQARQETHSAQQQLANSRVKQNETNVAFQHQQQETLLLNRVIAAAASSLEANKILETICEELARALDVPQSGVALLNPEHTHETVVAEYRTAERPSAIGIVIPLEGNEATQYVIENKKPLVLTNAQTDPRQSVLHAMEKERGTIALLIVPLVARNRVLGTLGLESDRPRDFSEEEIALAQNIANAASQVLESARLNAELRQELDEHTRTERQLQTTFQEMERAQTRARALLDATTDCILMISPEAHIVAVNWSFCRNFFGKHPRELYLHMIQDYQRELEQLFEDPAGLIDHIQSTIPNLEQYFTSIVVQVVPKRREYQLVSTPVRTSTNEYLGRLYVFHDVSREREIDRMRNEFVSMVSHELRTPLTSIKGYVDLLQSGAAGKVNEEQRDFLDIIKTNTDRLVMLVSDLLDLSRIEIGRLELRQQAVDVGLLIRQVVNTLHPQIDAKKQSITVEIGAHTPLVWADNDRVIQILTNLISNAHKYTPSGGTITVTAQATVDCVRVDVTDSGIGISPEDQAQLFTRFFRAQNRETQQAGGTGIGLAITRSLVEMHGGEIFVTSTPGHGSTFSFTLPTEPTEPHELKRQVVEKNILVIDENQEFTKLMKLFIERAGYHPLIAHSGKDAIDLARKKKPDLISLDLLLPDINGFQILDSLKEMPETRQIPVMILSVLAEREEGKLLGAIDYLAKPFTESALLEHFDRIFKAGALRSILVAQGETQSRKLIGLLLTNAGYDVIESHDGASTLRMVTEKKLDLVFLDLKFSDMDGIDLLRQLRAKPSTRNLPIVMMPGYKGISNASQQAIVELGAPTMLTKPITAEKLATAIYQAIYSK